MKKLTETLIQQRLRTCTSDIDKVLKINITGRELEDVSILKRMTGVEILSLSVNKISSLYDFQNLKNLKELYLRHNNISDLNEIFYLKNLPKLELLTLSENPCCEDPLYRLTVIKNLRNLIELDGMRVSHEERKEAAVSGKDVIKLSDSISDLRTNYIPDGPQILRTPTSSVQKIKLNLPEEEYPEGRLEAFDEPKRAVEDLIPQDNQTDTIVPLQSKKSSASNLNAINPLIYPASVETLRERKSKCKHCLSPSRESIEKFLYDPHHLRIAPKNSNILSAVLNLVKELDYASLQILSADIVSRLSASQKEYCYHPRV